MLLMTLICGRCSGGVPLRVQGHHLAAVSEPRMVVYVNNRQFTNVSLFWLLLLYFYAPLLSIINHHQQQQQRQLHQHNFVRHFYYLCRRVASGEGNVMLSVTWSRCHAVCVRRISLGGEGNALYPVISIFWLRPVDQVFLDMTVV